jgi:hypothetical protein
LVQETSAAAAEALVQQHLDNLEDPESSLLLPDYKAYMP